jgi:hypothetical protein
MDFLKIIMMLLNYLMTLKEKKLLKKKLKMFIIKIKVKIMLKKKKNQKLLKLI